MQTTPRKPSSCLDLKNQGKKSAKTRKLGFLKNDCAWGGGDSRKPTKNQGENQGSRKPSVLVGFLRQKKGLCILSQDPPSTACGMQLELMICADFVEGFFAVLFHRFSQCTHSKL